MASHVSYSEETAGIIDEEIHKIINDSLQKARKLLSENRKLLDNMARLLVERETIFSEEVDMLMEGKSVEEIMAFMDENERTLRENPFKRKGVIVPERRAEQSAPVEQSAPEQPQNTDGEQANGTDDTNGTDKE